MDLVHLRTYLEYLRDLGVYDLYRHGEPDPGSEIARQVSAASRNTVPVAVRSAAITPPVRLPSAAPNTAPRREARTAAALGTPAANAGSRSLPPAPQPSSSASERQALEVPIGKLVSLGDVLPAPVAAIAAAERAQALVAVRAEIGDCTRCPLAYAGRHTIVFGEGDPNAALMFVGEGPGADEDASGRPFVGKAGQLLNNMITAMGLQREQVYIANIVKCRPPGNRVPEPTEANTCTPFLAQQLDIVRPQVVVALGSTAAMYLLGVRQSLGSLRGRWHAVRGAKVAVTYHPAFLLRDPRQKGEAWKDLQRVMTELKLKPPVPPRSTANKELV